MIYAPVGVDHIISEKEIGSPARCARRRFSEQIICDSGGIFFRYFSFDEATKGCAAPSESEIDFVYCAHVNTVLQSNDF